MSLRRRTAPAVMAIFTVLLLVGCSAGSDDGGAAATADSAGARALEEPATAASEGRHAACDRVEAVGREFMEFDPSAPDLDRSRQQLTSLTSEIEALLSEVPPDLADALAEVGIAMQQLSDMAFAAGTADEFARSVEARNPLDSLGEAGPDLLYWQREECGLWGGSGMGMGGSDMNPEMNNSDMNPGM